MKWWSVWRELVKNFCETKEVAKKIFSSLKSESLTEINSSKANNVPAENYTMNLNKSSQPENIKHNGSSQKNDSIVNEKLNKTATLEEKVKLTVKFEVKNNTKCCMIEITAHF